MFAKSFKIKRFCEGTWQTINAVTVSALLKLVAYSERKSFSSIQPFIVPTLAHERCASAGTTATAAAGAAVGVADGAAAGEADTATEAAGVVDMAATEAMAATRTTAVMEATAAMADGVANGSPSC